MGYDTCFYGEFKLDKPLTAEHKAYLDVFADTRRIKRDPVLTEKLADPRREAVGLPLGIDAGYFVGLCDNYGPVNASDVSNYNQPPAGQPGLWCRWVPDEDGTHIVWDQGEKFYFSNEWLEYLVEHFLGPWGYVLNGFVEWNGEDDDDRGVIYVKDNKVEAVSSTVSNPGPSWNKLGSAEKVFGKAMVDELKEELKEEPKDPTTRMVDELLGEEGE